jgi:hypothetical protein
MISNPSRGHNATKVTAVPDLTLRFGDDLWKLGPVQEIQIVIDQLTPCIGSAVTDQPLIGTTVSGFAQVPIQRTGSFAGINGPHTSQVWPVIGGFPTSLSGILGDFTGIHGLEGTWSAPAGLHRQVSAGSLTARATVDVAIPPLSNTSKAVWDSDTPIQATVRVTNVMASYS